MIIRPTDMRRVPLTQEANVILPPCGQQLLRQVLVLIPGGDPTVLAGESVLPNEIGPNRVYKLAPLPPGTTIKYALGPAQFLTAAVESGHTAITLIIEYLPLPAGYTDQRMMPAAPEMPTKDSPTRELT